MTVMGREHPRSDGSWLNHPPGVAVLVALKAWELFSYQGMRAFLVFYLIGAFAMSDGQASIVFGSYAALVLSLSVLGGLVSDRWLGMREPMTVGAVLIMSGHLCLAAENVAGALGSFGPTGLFQMFCIGLSLISVGTGLLKPNVLNLLGSLYLQNDPKRERGYYLYYLGVNVGSFLAPLVCGYLAANYGWGWGFAAAAIGMAAGLMVLLLGRRRLAPAEPSATTLPGKKPRVLIYLGVLAAVGIASFLIQHGVTLGLLLLASLAAASIYFVMQARLEPGGRGGIVLIRLLALMAVPLTYSILFEQFSLSINLFTDRVVDRQIFGWSIAAPQLLSLNAFFVLAFLPLLAAAWTALARRGREPRTASKFAVGFACIAMGFFLLASASGLTEPGTRIPIGYVVLAYFLITMGELCIAPLAYATVGLLVPQRLQGVAMGMLMLAFALGNLGASWLATTAAIPSGTLLGDSRAAYAHFFLTPACVALIAVPMCLLASRLLNARHRSSSAADTEQLPSRT